MKLFQHMELLEAYKHVANDGQALHVWIPPEGKWPGAPKCFLKSNKQWGHLMDLNEERLIETAKRLGVKVIKVAQCGRRSQHIDLCGKPLEKAIKECEDLFGE